MEPEPVAPVPIPAAAAPEPEPEPVRARRHSQKRASEGLYAQGNPKILKSGRDIPKEINRIEGKLMRQEMDFNKAVEGMDDIITVSEYFDRYIKELKDENAEIFGMIVDISNDIEKLDDEISRLNTKFTDEYASVRDTLQMMQPREPSMGRLKNNSKKKKKKSKKRKSKKRKSKK